MKYEPIPVTPALIVWARTRAGYSLDEVREHFKYIEEWEAGEASPSYPQLEKMAERFKIPIAVFFFPQPPEIPAVSESFRTLPEQEFERLPRRIRYLLRKAKAFQINLVELTGGQNPAPRSILRDLSFRANTSITAMANRVRDYLGVSIDDQSNWTNAETALKNWREILLNVGIFTFKDAFRETGYSGFCLYNEDFPLIYVNNTGAKTRQSFTLFHELAHLLFHTSGIDAINDDFIARLPDNNQKIEVIGNRFAAEFLLPNRVFEAAFEGLDPSEATAAKLANRFHVSREFIFRKFLDRGLISQADYKAAAKAWENQRSGGSGGGDHYYNVIAYLGREYINLAFSQYYQNQIDDYQLAEYLDVKPKNLSTLEGYVTRGAE